MKLLPSPLPSHSFTEYFLNACYILDTDIHPAPNSKGEMLNEWQVKCALTDGDRLNGEKLNRMGLYGLAKESFTDQVTLSQIWGN